MEWVNRKVGNNLGDSPQGGASHEPPPGGGAQRTASGRDSFDPVVVNTNAASDSGDDLFPQVTSDGLGNWIAVWESDDPSGAGFRL